ncbi:MAG: hypothetical protein J0I06_24675 [Planctomycetes bacterium]|nr:hypothetical protein [Planctomycetota bacterium]
MTRKAAPKRAKKPAKPKPVSAYIVVREMVSVNRSYTEPDRVFLSRSAARKHAGELNRELRALLNPFDDGRGPGDLMSDGQEAFDALLKKLGLSAPKKSKGDGYLSSRDWAAWWDRTYYDVTETQRDAIWDALDEFKWYTVTKTTLE